MAYSDKSDAELAKLVTDGKATDWEYKEWQRRRGVSGKHQANMDKAVEEHARDKGVARGFSLFGNKK